MPNPEAATTSHARRERAVLILLLVAAAGLLAWATLNGGAAARAVLFAVFAVTAWLVLATLQRRRAGGDEAAGARQARSAADAERLELALRGGDLALWDLHLPSRHSTVNERWFQILGHGVGAIAADEQGWQALLHPEDRDRVLAALDRHLSGQTGSYEATYRMRHRDGHWVWVLDRGRVVERDAQGRPLRIVGTHMDVSERHAAQEALQRSEDRLRMASRLARLGGWRLDLPQQQLVLTSEAAAIIGAPADEPLSLERALRLFPRVGREQVLQRLAELAREGEHFELELDAVTPGGGVAHLRVLGETLRDAAGALVALRGAVQDITESRLAQQQLQLLEACVARLNDIVLITEVDGVPQAERRIAFVNDAFERLTGYRRDEVLGRSPRLLHGPQTDMAEVARIEHALAAQQSVRAELLNYTKAGRPYWIELEIVPLVGLRGRTTHMVAVERDISERKRAEAEIRAAQASLAATLEAVPDLLFEIDIEGRVHGHHSPRSDLLYTTPDHFLGRRVGEFLPADAAGVLMAALREAHRAGYSVGLQYELALEQGRHWFELSVARKPVAVGELPRFVVLARDVTERRHAEDERRLLERQLREAQKMESIGTLAGGIAHDFNNILAGILGNVALARDDLPSDHTAQASLAQINKAGLRARSLVQQILTFSRHQPQQLQVQPLRPVLEESVDLLRATLPASVRLEVALQVEPLLVEADATQLHQVMMNLCTNAWHALPPDGGRLEVGLDAAAAAADDGGGERDGELPRGPCAHLWVRDDGCGMDAATRERIFDPFFTTKPVGLGTGLGLSVVHGIVRGHQGAIRVDTAPGSGTTVHVYLPLDGPAAARAPGHALPPPSTVGAGQHVLYVDDDDVMVLMMQRLLQRAGYRVTACNESPQALAIVQARPEQFDLVISDHNMPEMSGIELAERLSRLQPGLPVVISSGFIGDELRQRARGAGVRALLNKESAFEDLVGVVQRALAPVSA